MTSRAIEFDPPFGGGDESSDPVVTYSRVAGQRTAGRREPRFEAVPEARAPRRDDVMDLDILPQIEGPSSDLDFDDEIPPKRPRRRRRGASRLVFLVGALALLAGAGVLAATYSGIVRQEGAVVPIEPEVAAADTGAVSVAPADVRVIASYNSVGDVPAAGSDGGSVPAIGAAPTVSADCLVAAPPMPRLRPPMTTPSFSVPPPVATAATTFEFGGVPAPVAPAAQPPGGEIDDVLASVDQILAGERAAPGSIGTTGGFGQPPAAGGAQIAPAGTYLPPRATMRGEIFGPPAPPPFYGAPALDLASEAPPSGQLGGFLPPRGVFMPSGPVPPGEIPLH